MLHKNNVECFWQILLSLIKIYFHLILKFTPTSHYGSIFHTLNTSTQFSYKKSAREVALYESMLGWGFTKSTMIFCDNFGWHVISVRKFTFFHLGNCGIFKIFWENSFSNISTIKGITWQSFKIIWQNLFENKIFLAQHNWLHWTVRGK